MRNILTIALFLAGLIAFSLSSQAGRETATLSATTSIEVIGTLTGKGSADLYTSCVHMFGTFSGATVTLLVSTDAGTTKTAMDDKTGVAFSVTANKAFCFDWGWPTKASASTIFYASVAGASSAPSITVNVDDSK